MKKKEIMVEGAHGLIERLWSPDGKTIAGYNVMRFTGSGDTKFYKSAFYFKKAEQYFQELENERVSE